MSNRPSHIRLNSHPGAGTVSRFPIEWGAATAKERGPVVGTVNSGSDRNAIGAHGGAYSVYRALAVSSGAMSANNRPDLTNTAPTTPMGPFPQWTDASKIVSLDPGGARVAPSDVGIGRPRRAAGRSPARSAPPGRGGREPRRVAARAVRIRSELLEHAPED